MRRAWAARGRALPLALLLLAAPSAAPALAPRIGAPVARGGTVRWGAPADSVPAWARGLALPPGSRGDSLAFWRAVAARPLLRGVGLHRLGQAWLAAGDSARADSCWTLAALDTALLPVPSPWAWVALRDRATLMLARGQAARADSLLERARRGQWPESDRAAWLALRARLRAQAGDTARAVELAGQALRVYPAQGATAQSLAVLDDVMRARGAALAPAEARLAAEVEIFRGDRAGAALRLRRALEAAGPETRWSLALRLSEVLRSARRYGEAHGAQREAARAAALPRERALAALERARIFRDAGQADSALAWYARAAASGVEDAAPAAAWEAGRTAEDTDRWGEALRWYARVARGGGRRAPGAEFRAGLMEFAAGRPDSACAWWRQGSDEGTRFWLGVALRARGEPVAGDLALWSVAAAPGYSFYRALARDTLRLRGWPGRVARPDAAARCAAVGAAAELESVGDPEDAGRILLRLAVAAGADGARAGCDPAGTPLAGAAGAYAAGRAGLAFALAQDAFDAAPDSLRWDVAPWAYPPAWESLLVAPRDTVVAALEPALLFALVLQESRFDPLARSRSDALGLMQLKLETAADMARLLRDHRPTEAALFDPGRNVRYGALYLRRLLRRFDGSAAAALSAYNAGPSTLPGRWREILARGGEALLCELASNALAQDYAKRIMGFRAAYRELRPTGAP